MDYNEKQKTLQTLTIAQVESKSFSDQENQTDEQKREFAKQMLYPNLNIKEEVKEKPKLAIQHLADSAEITFKEPEQKKEVEILNNTLWEEEIESQINVEEDVVQAEEFVAEEIETINDQEKESAKIIIQPAKQKNFKLRLKLAVCAFALVLTCLGGWAIFNAIEIKTLTAEAQAAKNQYNINVATVISNVSKLDDLTNPNSITNLDELSSAEIIPITPKDKTAPTTFEKESNWFDRVCNWLSNLFN